MQCFELASIDDGGPNYAWIAWSRGIPQTSLGDLGMVIAWSRLGSNVRNSYEPGARPADDLTHQSISVERT